MIGFARAFAYEAWASRRVLARLREIPGPPREIVRLFAHTQAGLKVWATRIRSGDSSDIPIWPELSLEDCERLIEENERAYREILTDSAHETLGRTISYTNQHGITYETSVEDILGHIVLHGGYHRGQVARCLREGGHEPVNTDYITYVRELAGQPWKP